MPLSERHRRELQGIVALLAGVFVVLTLLPFDVTGPLGRAFGGLLWQYLGFGAAMFPLGLFAVSVWGFDRIEGDRLKRTVVLFAGLALLVPFGLAIAAGIATGSDLPPDYDTWTLLQKSVGIVAAMLLLGVKAAIGAAGAVILALIALSSLTVYTFQWHPLAALRGRSTAGPPDRRTADDLEVDEEKFQDVMSEEFEEEPEPSRRPAVPPSRRPDGKEPNVLPLPTSDLQLMGLADEESLPAIEAEINELPSMNLLDEPNREGFDAGEEELDRLAHVLIDTLATFKVRGKAVGRTTGPVVTRFEVKPAPGVKVGKIAALADDLALAMKARSVRIVAPIPGKAAVGVEVPNPTPRIVTFRELLESREWEDSRGALPVALGRDLEGRPIVEDLSKMPHLLIAGATGSGKSVCINTIITSLIYRYTPRELRMLMIDPKMVELATYNSLPHLRHPVVTKNKQAAQTMKWAVMEMERRYELFGRNTARNLFEFNKKQGAGDHLVDPQKEAEFEHDDQIGFDLEDVRYTEGPLPYIVIIVDELADLMMTVAGEVERPLALLAQKARATGIHLILATQRPSVNVITGLIKANFPSRIAFRVASKVDSRTILDQNGAEALLGNGDMLFLPPGRSEPIRAQGAFVTTAETENVTDWYRGRKAARDERLKQQGLVPPEEREADILKVVEAREAEPAGGGAATGGDDRDELFREAAELCIQHQLGSTSLLQRRLRIGYGRAARIIDQLELAGILGPADGSKAREILISPAQLEEYLRQGE